MRMRALSSVRAVLSFILHPIFSHSPPPSGLVRLGRPHTQDSIEDALELQSSCFYFLRAEVRGVRSRSWRM